MIVAATLPLLLGHGEPITSREIAEAAGVAEGTIFRVFADKDEVIAAAVDLALDPSPMETALGAIDVERPLSEVLLEVVALLQERTITVWQLLSNVGPRFHERTRSPMTDSPGLVGILTAHRRAITRSPEAAARHLRAVTLAASHPLLSEIPTPPAEIAELFLHGIGRPGAC